MSDFIIVECDQGSKEWHAARAGVITASMFSTVIKKVNGLTEQQEIYVSAIRSGHPEIGAREMAGYKNAPKSETVQRALDGETVGDFSDAALNYAFRLAVERIAGEPLDEGFETFFMRRGHELEPDARMEHEAESGLVVQRAGFVTTPDGLFGASADGLINPDGGSEYKCFLSPEKLRAFHIDNDASSVMDQVQGCMWITGRNWWHVGLYCPALKSINKQLWWREFKRDDNHIERMEETLVEFSKVVDAYEIQLRKEAA